MLPFAFQFQDVQREMVFQVRDWRHHIAMPFLDRVAEDYGPGHYCVDGAKLVHKLHFVPYKRRCCLVHSVEFEVAQWNVLKIGGDGSILSQHGESSCCCIRLSECASRRDPVNKSVARADTSLTRRIILDIFQLHIVSQNFCKK